MPAPTVARTPFDPLVPARVLDLLFAVVGGLGIGVPVGALFYGEGGFWAVLCVPAFFFTTLTTFFAGRARGDAGAVLGTFVGSVVPPTVLFLPTGIGALLGAGAGLLAAFALLPLVLVLRAAHAAPRDDDGEHVAVFATAWLLTISVVLVLTSEHRAVGLVLAPLAVAGVLALATFVRDAARATFLRDVRAGRAPGFAVDDLFTAAAPRTRGGPFSLLRAVSVSGAGPFRAGAAGASHGAVSVPRARIAAALALLALATAGAVLVLRA